MATFFHVTADTLSQNHERSLLARAAAGDGEALRILIQRHGSAVFLTASRLLDSEDDAEDVVQEVFIGLPESLETYEHRDRFEAWLHRLTARVALMHLRRNTRRRRILDHSHEETGALAPVDEASRLDLDAAIRALPEDLRVVFVLKIVVGHSHDEIALRLGIRRGTSEVRLYRAIRRLRIQLKEDR